MAKGWHGTGAALAALMLTTTLAGAPPATAADQQPTDPRSEAILQAGAQVFVPPQRVAPQVTLVARAGSHVEIVGPRGTRVWTASAMTDTGIPAAALRAYHDAATTLAREDPTCRLPWTLLAAIGRVESDHGRYGGSVLSADGVSHPSIIGIPLNGAGPVAAIRDTDGGRLDGDTVWDR
ncbi:MAG: lytic transglycosylase domain-containing protein, partial [Nocardioidaceae bacterium]